MKTVIQQLTEAFGPSGYETEVTDLIKEMVEAYADEVRTDVLGNVIAIKKGSQEGRDVMFAAHTDEIGLVVTFIDDKGFLRFANVGGVSVSPWWAIRSVCWRSDGVIYQEKGMEGSHLR